MDNKKNGIPKLRFPGFTGAWEQRKLGEEFKRVNERNNGEFGKDRWISVAKMYFQDPDKVTSNNIDTRTYVMRLGDIAFEGNSNNEFKFGRFVANDIGDGVVSELFPIYRHIRDYDNNYWKYAIHLERIMRPIFAKSITSSGSSSNKLAPKDLLRQSIFLPNLDEQKKIGAFFINIDSLIALHQRKLEHLQEQKKGLLQKMFPKNGENVPEVRFPGFTDAWEQRKLGEVVERFDNLRIPVTSSKREKGITPYYGANGIQDYVQGYTHDGEFVLVAEDGANDLQNYPVHYVNGKVWVNNHAHVLQGKNKMVDNLFLVNAIKQIKIETYLVGGSRAKLNADVMMKLPIKVPTFNEQQKIGEYFSKFDTLITLHQRKPK